MTRRTSRTLAVLGVLVLAGALNATAAVAAQRYALTGQFDVSAAAGGTFAEPTSIAVDDSTGDLYVLEHARHVVAKFDSEGHYISELTGTPTGSGGSQTSFSEPGLIAVENFPGPTQGDVYLIDDRPLEGSAGYPPPVVDQFSSTGVYLSQLTGSGAAEGAGNSQPFGRLAGLAAGPGGALWLTERGEYYSSPVRGEPAILEFKESGIPTEPWTLALRYPDGFGRGLGGDGNQEPLGIALDSSNHLYLDHEEFDERWQVSSSGGQDTLTEDTAAPLGAATFAVDPVSSDVFADITEANVGHIVMYGPFGEPEGESFGSGESVEFSRGIAVNGSTHTVYASSSLSGEIAVFNEFTPAAPAALTHGADGIAQTTATLTGEVNPRALHTRYWFEYGVGTEYGQRTPATAAGEEAEAVSVGAQLKGLAPGTGYHYRLVAENIDGTVYGQDETFASTVFPPPTVSTGPSEDVTQTSAVITATVEPHGLVSAYNFEVGGTPAYGSAIPGIVPGEAETVRLLLTNLVPGTTYHYRLVAESQGGTGTGEDQAFTTSPPLFAPAAVSSSSATSPGAQPPKAKALAPKPLTKAQKLAAALKACKQDHSRSKRASCERSAHKKYGASKQAASKKAKR
jgi:hypothetical protein